jgi:hypothetical protein
MLTRNQLPESLNAAAKVFSRRIPYLVLSKALLGINLLILAYTSAKTSQKSSNSLRRFYARSSHILSRSGYSSSRRLTLPSPHSCLRSALTRSGTSCFQLPYGASQNASKTKAIGQRCSKHIAKQELPIIKVFLPDPSEYNFKYVTSRARCGNDDTMW